MEKNEFDTIKMEKENAMRRYRTFKNVANVLRTVEIFVVVALITFSISWTSSCVPSVVKFCNALFRRVSSVFFSPHFVFLIGNVIIITLFANFSSSEKSGGQESSPVNADCDVKPENANVTVEENVTVPPPPAVSAVVEVFVPEKEPEVKVVKEEERVYRRTKSAAARMEAVKVAEKEKDEFKIVVRQGISNSEVAEKAAAAEAMRRRRFEEDELSNDEFRKKVEQFIEKQQRFIIKESKSVVLSNSNSNFITAGKYFRSRSM